VVAGSRKERRLASGRGPQEADPINPTVFFKFAIDRSLAAVVFYHKIISLSETNRMEGAARNLACVNTDLVEKVERKLC
jgi:hypothetical protein